MYQIDTNCDEKSDGKNRIIILILMQCALSNLLPFFPGKTASVVCSVSLQSVSQWEQELSNPDPSGVTLWPNFILFPEFPTYRCIVA